MTLPPHFFQLIFSDVKGRVFNFPALSAAGMKAGRFFELESQDFLKLPASSEIFMLPDRSPVGFDPETGGSVVLDNDPYSKKSEPCFAMAAFIPPGHTLTHNAAYQENDGATLLPLFAYGAIAFREGDFYVAAYRIDKDNRHDERLMDIQEVKKKSHEFEKLFPTNRLVPHLANCATANACANAKNFFLGRFEAPLPTSPVCNAQCQGCISFQPANRVLSTQSRITFIPTPEEIAEIALFHIAHVPDALVSFGQGCEGEPTLSGEVIEEAIRRIRQRTSHGLININTNASNPRTLARLFEAGLNTIRVSTNSAREPYYSHYYQPKGYSLKEVIESVDVAKKAGGFVSINYLSMPGFTDSKEEFAAFKDLIGAHRVDMVQWRNLNYDPISYFKDLRLQTESLELVGMGQIIHALQKEYPKLLMGYFNPKKI